MAPEHSLRAGMLAERFVNGFEGSDKIVREISSRIGQIYHLYEEQLEPIFGRYDLNRPVFSALVALRLSYVPYELRHHELKESMVITSGGLTNLCKRLESLGLITRRPDPDDKRGVIFSLTESGLVLTNELLPQQHVQEHNLVEALNKEEQETLNFLLQKVVSGFDRS